MTPPDLSPFTADELRGFVAASEQRLHLQRAVRDRAARSIAGLEEALTHLHQHLLAAERGVPSTARDGRGA